MFLTTVENFVLFGTCFALAGFAVAWTARRVAARGWWQPQPFTLTRLYACALTLPPIAALWLVVAALLPEWLLTEAAFDAAHPAPVHRLHLLGDVTAGLEPHLAYSTLLFAFAASALALWSSVRSYTRVGRVVGQLEMNVAPPAPEQITLVEAAAARHALNVGLVMSDNSFSFVWGYTRPKLVLSSGLLRELTPDELTGVLEHEAAHHRRRDNIVKLLLSVCGYASLAFPLSRLVLRWRAEQVELVCDEVAASLAPSPLEIASALVKVRRQSFAAARGASGFMPEGEGSFERRVHRLIAFADAPPAPTRAAALSQTPRNGTLLIAASFTTTLLFVSAYAPLAVHRLAEAIIHIIG